MRPSNAATPAPAERDGGRRFDLLGWPIDNETNCGADSSQEFSSLHAGAAGDDLRSTLAFLSGEGAR